MEANRENNRVVISGWVQQTPSFSHSLYGEAFYTFPLVVPRLSGTEDVLPVTAGERLLPTLPEEGEELLISGQLRSYNIQCDGANRLLVTVFARGITPKPEQTPYCNEIALIGYICKPPIYRTTPFAREIADILLAVNRPYHKSDYLPVIAWGRNARFVSGLVVGDRLNVMGRVQSRPYQKSLPDGTVQFRVAYEVSAATVEWENDGNDNEQ